MARVGADVVDSRDEDWAISEFDGQTHFSDDGQSYQPIDPTVKTGTGDELFSPPSSAFKAPMPGDLPSYFDYLRRPGVAEEFSPRVFPAPKTPRDNWPVVSFENPWEPMPKYGRRANRRPGVMARFDRTVAFGDDAQGFGKDFLNPGEYLQTSLSLVSPNKQYRLRMQPDGNLVLYKGETPLWYTRTTSGKKAIMQTDGNFVVYDAQNRVAFNTGTNGRPGARMVLQDDGNLVIKDPRTGAVFWNSGTWGGVAARDQSSKSFLGSVGSAIGSVGGAIGSVVTTALPIAQTIISFVPGVGAGVNAAIAAGTALAKGQPITDAVIAAAKGAIPGGPLAQQALESAVAIAKGKNVSETVLAAARNQIPGGEVAKRAFDTGLALAKGHNLQRALGVQGLDDAAGGPMSFLTDQINNLSPINNRVMSNQGPQFIGNAVEHAIGVVATPLRNVGQAILSNPALRSLPIEELARRLNVSPETARDAVASLVSTVAKAGGPSIAHMSPAFDLSRQLPTRMSFDQAMSQFASGAGPSRYGINATRRARPLVMSWLRGAQGFTAHIGEASGLDPTGVAYLVESGDSMSKISTKLTGTASRVGELIKANPQVKDPNKIFVGQRLNLPASWQTKPAVATGPVAMTTLPSPTSASTNMPTLPAPIASTAPILATSMPTLSVKAKSSGAPVIAWQNILIRDGFAQPGTADGFFGPNSEARTMKWQAAHGLGADGVVGPNTWAKALATLPTTVPGPSTPLPTSVSTPLGPIALPPMFQPISTVIAENPAAPISPITGFPTTTPAALPGSPITGFPMLPPAAPIPPIGTVLGSTPVPNVVATQTGPSEVTVSQPPIGPDPSAAKPGMGALGAVALALGALYVVGKGKMGL